MTNPESRTSELATRSAGPVLLFDGVCNLCNSSVNFLIDRDPAGRLRYASLQSDAGAALAAAAGINIDAIESLVLVEGERGYVRSAAALRVTRYLGFPWPLLRVGLLVPRFLRDALYNVVARNRYKWFGKAESCRMPTDDIAGRFLE